MADFVSHLECSLTGEIYEKNKVHGLSRAGRPLLVRYDLDKLKNSISKTDITKSEAAGFWRYAPFLPVSDAASRISLGEVMTPLMPLKSAEKLGGQSGKVLVKDEGRLPTGSFKARGLALAVSMAHQFGLDHLAIPTNGNAGAAMAAYARQAGMKATVLCPSDTPDINIREIQLQGADTYLVNGLINDCGKIVGEGKEATGWFDVSTLKEPYRIEGKKTMGLELAEQLGWRLPDAIFYPTGGGTGLIGMWKAFAELAEIGWITGKMPKMFAIQAEGCAPIVRAYDAGEEHAPLWQDAHTVAAGIRVPVAVGDFLILRAVRESGGAALSVSDAELMQWRDDIAADEGVLLCPEGAATAAGYQKALAQGLVQPSDKVVLFNCATGLKYPMPAVAGQLDKNQPIEYSQFT
ncbi:MAG: threonine synthase [Candidatus Puniceispirillaceae bacterium]